ncbi:MULTISPECIES: serine hydrolase [Betaproteobacteria]|uniref:Serine hydrolase domain-containing protein n=1 Tax=Acidovorax facilis TaxID=12917 RepID=A0ABV8DB28_9BURK|nr:serine hydrolase domain-containing protein [Acidovorax sp. SD340]MBO1009712.1 beta-lactamase family protein [Acidovorax sp. SD340]MCO4243566.1 beta-lactamase family protein [Acidovorax facilis]
MTIAAIVLALLLVAAICAMLYLKWRMANTPDRKNLAAAIDAEVAKHMKSGRFPGIAVGVFKDGKTFIKGYGTVNKEISQIPDGHTVFQIASVSKVLTASLLQALCDEGVVSMDATLGELLGASMALSPSARAVTLRQLATHTSGFPGIPESLGDKARQMAGDDDPLLNPYSYLGREFVFDYLATAEGQRAAGRFEYSNFGMGLLGHVLEAVTGRDYESLVREKVLAPLGMHSTAIALAPATKARLAQGYTGKGLPTPIWTFAALAGAGAYSSTAEDMLSFIQASLADHGPAAQRFQSMCVPQFGGEFGIGWAQPTFLHRFFGNRGVVWHNGMVAGYAAYLSIDEASKSGVVILTNQASATEMLGMMVMRQVRTQSWASSPPSN